MTRLPFQSFPLLAFRPSGPRADPRTDPDPEGSPDSSGPGSRVPATSVRVSGVEDGPVRKRVHPTSVPDQRWEGLHRDSGQDTTGHNCAAE